MFQLQLVGVAQKMQKKRIILFIVCEKNVGYMCYSPHHSSMHF